MLWGFVYAFKDFFLQKLVLQIVVISNSNLIRLNSVFLCEYQGEDSYFRFMSETSFDTSDLIFPVETRQIPILS